MKTAFDPLQRLTTQESIRFVGTIGGVSTNLPQHLSGMLELFIGREVRTIAELAARIKDSSGCKQNVAVVSVEEAAAIGLIASIPSPTSKHKRYLLGDEGRVVNAMRRHRDWILPERRRQLFFRPMFESNGDYLLQAMVSLEKGGESESMIDGFRKLVQSMAVAKVDQLPTSGSGSKWDSYRQSVVARKRSIFGEGGAITDGNLSLEALQKQRRQASNAVLEALRVKRDIWHLSSVSAETAVSPEPKTLRHHFLRCRAWLEGLGLAEQKQGRGFQLSKSGEHMLAYFRSRLPGGPLSIPPSLETLSDCFRIDEAKAEEIWGAVVDDNFWEQAILTLGKEGTYTPTDAELKIRFDAAFDAVRVPGITEAMLSPLRQTLFFGFLWDGKPMRSLDSVMSGDVSIPAQYPNEYGFGRNRQGRLAYLFRKH